MEPVLSEIMRPFASLRATKSKGINVNEGFSMTGFSFVILTLNEMKGKNLILKN